MKWVWLTALLCAGTFGRGAAAGNLIFFDEDGDTAGPRGLYNYDTAMGAVTLRAVVGGTARFFAMDARPVDGKVFAVDLDPGNPSAVPSGLWTVDVNTGAYELVGSTGVAQMTGLSFQPGTGVLYGLRNGGNLYTINTVTGAATLVGESGAAERGLAFAGNGTLYAFGGAGQLFQLNPAGGAPTALGAGNAIELFAEDAAFGDDGRLYEVDFAGNIFRTDTSAGTGTLLKNVGLGTGVLALVAVPEPSAAAGTMLAAGLLAMRRVRVSHRA